MTSYQRHNVERDVCVVSVHVACIHKDSSMSQQQQYQQSNNSTNSDPQGVQIESKPTTTMTLKRTENEERKLVDYSLTKQDINQGRTRHPSELTDSAKMAHKKKQFPSFKTVQKYNLEDLLHDDEKAADDDDAGESKNVRDSGSSVHFMFPKRNKSS